MAVGGSRVMNCSAARALYVGIIVGLVQCGVLKAQNETSWPVAPQATGSGLLGSPALGSSTRYEHVYGNQAQGQSGPTQYSNAPYPSLQHHPYPATTPAARLAYPGQVPAKTFGGGRRGLTSRQSSVAIKAMQPRNRFPGRR